MAKKKLKTSVTLWMVVWNGKRLIHRDQITEPRYPTSGTPPKPGE